MQKTNEQPKISVLMACFREPATFVREAVESVLAQSFTDFECIVVLDDPQNKEIEDILNNYSQKDSRVKVIIHDAQYGLSASRNTGITTALGEYVAFMDADDVMLPNRLKEQLEWINANSCDIIFSHIEYISETGQSLGVFAPKFNPQKIKKEIFLRHLFAHPTAFAKREVFEKESYDEGFLRAQDIDLWLRLMHKGIKFGIVPEVLLQYRLYRNEAITKRISRQRGYARFGLKAAIKNFKYFWTSPFFWYFFFKRLGYATILLLPQSLLTLLVWAKDARHL